MEIRVDQASQPTFGGVLCGVMIAGLKDGVPTTRLLLRDETHREVVDLEEGDTYDLFGQGTLTVVAVHPRTEAKGRDAVTLRFDAAEDAS